MQGWRCWTPVQSQRSPPVRTAMKVVTSRYRSRSSHAQTMLSLPRWRSTYGTQRLWPTPLRYAGQRCVLLWAAGRHDVAGAVTDIAANIAESLADLIVQAAPLEEQGKLLAYKIANLGE